MISHPSGAAGTQELPSRRQLDIGRVALGLEVGHAAGGERIRTIEPGEGLLRRRPEPGRVEKHDVEPQAGRRRPDKGVGALDRHVARPESARRKLQSGGGVPVALDQNHGLRAARCGLEPERSGSGEEIETTRAFDPGPQPVEQGLAHSIGRGANLAGGGHRQPTAAPAPGDDAHRTSRNHMLHVARGRARADHRPTDACRNCAASGASGRFTPAVVNWRIFRARIVALP